MNKQDVEQRVAALRSDPPFDIPRWWLTFCLCGPPEQLETIAGPLSALSATNLGGGDGGFLHAKIAVDSKPEAVSALIEQVSRLTAPCGVQLLAVDADTGSDPWSSSFREILRSEGP